MKWKEIYDKSNNKKYAQIIDIDEPLKLHANIKNFIFNYKIYIAIFLIIFLLLIIFTYKGNWQAILATFAMLAITTLLMIYYHTYKIETKNDKLNATIDFKRIQIEYSNLINIYMSKEKLHLFFIIPIYTYSINIIFIDNDNQMVMTLSTLMANKNDVYKFFKKIKVHVLPQQKQEAIRIRENELRKKSIIITVAIVALIAFIVFAIIVAIKMRK